MTRTELTELILLAQKGDNSAIEQIYLLTHNSVFNKIYCATNNADDAEDILQSCYLTVIEKIGDLKEPESFEKWFNTIVANKIKDHKKKNFPVLLDENEYNVLSNTPEEKSEFIPHEIIERADNIEVIRKLISELSDKNRQSIEMHYFEHKSISEISDELGIPENTVKTRLHNGRKEIKQKAKINAKKILITILVFIILAIIAVFCVFSSGKYQFYIDYTLHQVMGDLHIKQYSKQDATSQIDRCFEPCTLTYLPEICEPIEIGKPNKHDTSYFEFYGKDFDYYVTFYQRVLSPPGSHSFDTDNLKNITKINYNGYDLLVFSYPHLLSVMCNDDVYWYELNVDTNVISNEELKKIIDGIKPVDKS